MNIKILDSWLRDYLKTDAKPQKIAEVMSLTSVSIERIEPFKKDFAYDIEITTNRTDLMSVIGLAREASTVLSQNGIKAEFKKPDIKRVKNDKNEAKLTVINNERLTRRVCAVVMDVEIKSSPAEIQDRLEATGIRSLNNLIDVTNYVMRTIGHPAHVFDYDRVMDHLIKIRQSKKGEKIKTLDEKTYTLPGGDIIAEDGSGRIIDLLAIMGLENSVVTENTKRIIYFIDNNDPARIRKTSMSLAIRTEAAQLEEKGIDPELAMEALLYGIQLFKDLANGKVVSEIIDIYPEAYKEKIITISEEKLQQIIGVPISIKESADILRRLDFKTDVSGKILRVAVPSFRADDVSIPEDLAEEVARIYGYHNIPTALPPLETNMVAHYTNQFYWEQRVKEAMRYWGYTEVYTYSMVSETMFEGELSEAVTIKNPLTEDLVYMRRTLVPSLLKVVTENPSKDEMKIFEIANVYHKRVHNLPDEELMFAGVIKKTRVSFFEAKGLFEQLRKDLGIQELTFTSTDNDNADIYIGSEKLGDIEVLDDHVIDFEVSFDLLVKHATLKKSYVPIAKYPPIIEDMAFMLPEEMQVGTIMALIKKQNILINDVQLFDKYQDSRTFRIYYQDPEKNLTTEDVTPIREKIAKVLKEKGIHLK